MGERIKREGVYSYCMLSVEIELKGGGARQGRVGKLIPMGSFDIRQGVRQLWTWKPRSSGDDADGRTWL